MYMYVLYVRCETRGCKCALHAGRCWYFVENEASARKSLFTTVLAILWQACTRHRFLCCLYSLRRRKALRPLLARRALVAQSLSGVHAAAVGGGGAARTHAHSHPHANGNGNGGTHLSSQQQQHGSSGYGSENEYHEEYLPAPSPVPPGASPSPMPASGLYPELPADELRPATLHSLLPHSCLDFSKQRYGGA